MNDHSDDATGDRLREGQVFVGQFDAGWYLVMIGRARKVKRFNLREAEARQLVEQLKEYLGEADAGE
jgi:hypothetical protein